MASDIQKRLIEFICRNFMVEEHEVALDKSLVDEGIIDSFGLVEISSFICAEFGFEVQNEELTRANFGSVLKIVAYIERKVTL